MQAGGAGYTEWLMFHIWRPDAASGRCCPNVALPETVICRWSRPFYWYFTSETGEILRKAKAKVSFDSVHKHFSKRLSRSGLVAQYLAFGNNKDMTATVEFLAAEGFTDLMERRNKAMSAIIQLWVEPRHNYNSLIKVIWSPQFCLIERKRNLLTLDDPEADFYDKLVTYEGLEHCSETEAVASPSLVGSIQLACLSISEHIKKLTGGNVLITTMTLYFKEGSKGKLWLLLCTHLKLYDIHKARVKEMSEVKLTIPEIARTKVFSRDVQYFELEKNRIHCKSCNALVKKATLQTVESKLILKCLEKGDGEPPQLGTSLSDSRLEGLPNILKRVNQSNYAELQQDFQSLDPKVEICEDCFLHYAKHYFERPVQTEPVLPAVKRVLVSVKSTLTFDEPRRIARKPDIARLYSPKTTSGRSATNIGFSSRVTSPGLPSINSRKTPTLLEIYTGYNSPKSVAVQPSGRSTKASSGRYTPSGTFRLR